MTGSFNQINTKRLPWVTIVLAALNVLAFIVLHFILGDTEDAGFMLKHGAVYAPAVLQDKEYWRLLTSIFMHFGIRHLFSNMITLGVIGPYLERETGHVRFAVIYLVSGILANVVTVYYYSWKLMNAVSAGASGAIFGIVGGLIGRIVRSHGRVQGLGMPQMLLMAGLCLYHGFTSTGVNNLAHISGLVFGFLTALILGKPKKDGRTVYTV